MTDSRGTPLPQGWQRGKLDDLVYVNRAIWDPAEGGTICYLDLSSVPDAGRLARPSTVTAERAPSRARRRASQGDILVSTVRPYLRGFAKVSAAPPNLVVSTGFAVLTPRNTQDTGFIYQHVLSERFVRHLQPRMTGSGYPAVRPEDIAEFPIPIPPEEERSRIGNILDSIDEAIEETEKVISATEELYSALLQELLTRGLPGWHKEWKDVPGIGTVPAEWTVWKLGEQAAAITSGSRGWAEYYSGGGALFVRSQNIRGGVVDSTDAVFVTPPVDREAERTRISPDDLLISITGEPGHAAIADRDLREAYVSQHVALIRLRTASLSAFVSLFLNCPSGQLQFDRMRYGQTRPGLNLENVANLLVALPQDPELQAIVALDASFRQVRTGEQCVLDRLEDVKVAVSEALLCGGVRLASTRDTDA